jgi:hypothetical protein
MRHKILLTACFLLFYTFAQHAYSADHKTDSFYREMQPQVKKTVVIDRELKQAHFNTLNSLSTPRSKEEETTYLYLLAELYNTTIHQENILMFSGSQSQTLSGCISLAILEEIINHPSNAREKRTCLNEIDGDNSPDRRIYISDLFRYGMGSSMGAIPIALYFYGSTETQTTRFWADEIARLFVSYSKGFVDSDKLSKIVQSYTGTMTIANAFPSHKGISLYSRTEQEPVEFTNRPASSFQNNKEQHLEYTPLSSAITACAADSDKPHKVETSLKPINCSQKKSPNNPIERVSADINSQNASPFQTLLQIFSFGKVSAEEEHAERILQQQLTAYVGMPRNPLTYYAAIKPTIEYGQDKALSLAVVRRIIQSAFAESRFPTFLSMVKHLGFQMPTEEVLKKIESDLLKSLGAIEIYKLKDRGNTLRKRMVEDYLRQEIITGRLFLRNEINVIDENHTITTLSGCPLKYFLESLIPLMQKESGEPDEQAIAILTHFMNMPIPIQSIGLLTPLEWQLMQTLENMTDAQKFFDRLAQKPESRTLQTIRSTTGQIKGFFSSGDGGGGRSPSLTPPQRPQAPLDAIEEEWDTTDEPLLKGQQNEPTTAPLLRTTELECEGGWLVVEEQLSRNNESILTKFYEEYVQFISNFRGISPAPSFEEVAISYLGAKFNEAYFLTLQDFKKLLEITQTHETYYLSKKGFFLLAGQQSKTFSPLINALKNLIKDLTPNQ